MSSLIIISAPSGAGKTSLVKSLMDHVSDVILSVSCTTRSPRPSEINGKDYHFLSEKQFSQAISSGEFLEHAEVYGHHYGTLSKHVMTHIQKGFDVILEIDYQGALQIMSNWPDNLISLFIMPPSKLELEKRLRSRAEDSEEVIQRRVRAAHQDMIHYRYYDHVVINDDFSEALKQLQAIVLAKRNKINPAVKDQTVYIEKILKSFEKN